MKIIFSMMVVIIIGMLAGCKEEAKSQVWYKEHPDEWAKVYKECKVSGENSDNCNNAFEALKQISKNSKSLHEVIDFNKQYREEHKKEE